MAETEKLKQDISRYTAKAKALAEIRSGLISKIHSTVAKEIAPLINSRLPAEYSVSRDRTHICRQEEEGLPTDFGVILRLEHNGRIIPYEEECSEEVQEIKGNLRPLLAEIGIKYGFYHINMQGEI